MHIASLVGLVVFYSAIVVGKAGAGNISDEIRLFLNRLYADGGNLDYGKSFRYRDTLTCGLKCQQGTIFYPNSVCKCICKKNYSLYHATRCAPASWSSWGSWSRCIKSNWGGLRSRERVCKSRGRETPGACGGRGSMAITCTAVKKEFKIRKNVRDLTKEEFHDLLQAMTKFKKDKTKKGYRNIISWHGYPGRCPWYHHLKGHDDNHCSWHHHPLFQPWHRMITIQLELGLSRHLKNKTMGIPFWDWTEQADDIPYILRNPTIYDPVLKRFIENPFYSTFIKSLFGVKIYNQRKPWYPGVLMDRYILKGTVRAMMCHDYHNYDEQQSTIPHDQIHDCFCIGKKLYGRDACGFGMPTVEYAAWDPAFVLHHSAMDRLFVIRRTLEETNGVADWTESRVIGQYVKAKGPLEKDVNEAFDWPMSPFCNKSMNPESVTGTKGIWTMRNAYYNEQLFGYKYDNFNFGRNYKWEDLQRDFKNNVIKRKFWNDDYFATKLGDLTRSNSLYLPMKSGCAISYSNPKWSIRIEWKR